jgi:hypothetical protein
VVRSVTVPLIYNGTWRSARAAYDGPLISVPGFPRPTRRLGASRRNVGGFLLPWERNVPTPDELTRGGCKSCFYYNVWRR